MGWNMSSGGSEGGRLWLALPDLQFDLIEVHTMTMAMVVDGVECVR